MTLKKELLVKELEDSANRLEQARSNTAELHHWGDARLEGIDPFAEVPAEIDGIEAALLVAQSRIDELAQLLGEEIDNLRHLIEKIEGNFD
ncbi:MAG: hypothetical protein PVH82_13230 [Desulfobacteraceae bacterium]|jgi:hypothetical protein